ncbi:MAG: DUF3662 and FHA domain-containing protein [Buchananella hordeovulneris]|nr:DUF3662 and FHA domain-containing protein [Buchananella hordeovulneris]
MGVFDRVENRIERLFKGAFDLGRGGLQPVELISAVRNTMDDNVLTLERDRVVAHNSFVIRLSEADRAQLAALGEEVLADEFAAAATDHGLSQGYSFVGAVTVEFETDPTLSPGQFSVQGANKRGNVAPAPAGPVKASPAHPVVEIAGKRYLLTGPRTTIGRGSNAGIVVNDSGVSRVHCELSVTPQGTILTDLGSTNGTFVEGHRVQAATLLDGNTITIGRTSFMFWTSPEETA